MSDSGGSLTPGGSIPAGWYRDPAGTDQLRWWDGFDWTAHLAPAPTPTIQAQPSVAQAVVYAPAVASQPVGAERTYLPFQNSQDAGQWAQAAQPTQWNTIGSWMLATSPLWLVAGELLIFVVNTAMGAPPSIPSVTYSIPSFGLFLVLFLLTVLAALRDHAMLKRWGYRTVSSVAWILLGPLVYLIVRTVRVHAEVRRGIAPLIFYIVSAVVIGLIGIATAIAIPVYLAQHDLGSSNQANAASLANGLTTGLDKDGGNYQVTCPPFARPTTTPLNVSCAAVDPATNGDYTIVIEIDPATTPDGSLTFTLVSVTPPIAQ